MTEPTLNSAAATTTTPTRVPTVVPEPAAAAEPGANLVPVALKEIALDSPAFRASFAFAHDQIDIVEVWLTGMVRHAQRLQTDLAALAGPFDALRSSIAVPASLSEASVDQDYAADACRLFSNLFSEFATQTVKWSRRLDAGIADPVASFVADQVRPLKEARRLAEVTQKTFDTAVAKYYALPASKEPSAAREEAFQVYEARKAYLRAATDFGVRWPIFRAALDRLLLDVFPAEWAGLRRAIATVSTGSDGAVGRVDRLRAWRFDRAVAEPALERALAEAARRVRDRAETAACPSRSLDAYLPADGAAVPLGVTGPTDGSAGRPSRHGWLFHKTITGKPARTVWVRRWYVLHAGVLGWLAAGSRSRGVEESDRLGVLLVSARPAVEERRFCFEVQTKQTTMVVQAESAADVAGWLGAIDAAKREAVTRLTSAPGPPMFSSGPLLPADFAARPDDLDELTDRNGLLAPDDRQQGAGRPSMDRDDPTSRLLGRLDFHRRLVSNTGAASADAGDGDIMSVIGPSADPTAVAPTTLVSFPVTTGLSRAAIAAQAGLTGPVPAVLLANSWGTVDWAPPPGPSAGPSQTKAAAPTTTEGQPGGGPAASTGRRRAGTTGAADPPGHTVELAAAAAPPAPPPPAGLRLQDAQFRLLFPTAPPDEPVVLVFRASWATADAHELAGRVYVTARKLFFYSGQLGLVLATALPLADIEDVASVPSKECDILFLRLRSGGRVTVKTFVEPPSLLFRRLSVLVAHAKQEEPVGPAGLIVQLAALAAEPDEPPDSGRPVGFESDDVGRAGPPLPGRARLPSAPVTYRPSTGPSGSTEPTYQREFNVGAKTLFHLLFGDASDVFAAVFAEQYGCPVSRSPWAAADGALPSRQFVSTPSNTELAFQFVDERTEHVCYVVVTRQISADLPHAAHFAVVFRLVITHIAATRSRFAVYPSIQWTRSVLGRGLIARQAGRAVQHTANRVGELAIAAAVQLGKAPRSTKAVAVFGPVGPRRATPTPEAKPVAPPAGTVLAGRRRRYTLVGLAAREAGESIGQAGRSVGRALYFGLKSISIHRFLVGLVAALATIVFIILSSRFSSVVDDWRTARFLASVGVTTPVEVYRPIVLSHVTDLLPASILVDGHSDEDSQTQMDELAELCYSPFQSALLSSMYPHFLDQRMSNKVGEADGSDTEAQQDRPPVGLTVRRPLQNIATRRHDLVVAFRLIDQLERVLVEHAWAEWQEDEKNRCGRLSQHLSTLSSPSAPGYPDADSKNRTEHLARGWNTYCNRCFADSSSGFS